jgi:hypothetical protein
MVGKVTVKNLSGDSFLVFKDDPRISTGELVPANMGNRRSNEFKKRQSKSLSGKTAHSNRYGVVRYFSDSEIVPEGFFQGNIKLKGIMNGHKNWFHCPETLKNFRYYKGTQPDNLVPGRIYKNNNFNEPIYVDIFDGTTRREYTEYSATQNFSGVWTFPYNGKTYAFANTTRFAKFIGVKRVD